MSPCRGGCPTPQGETYTETTTETTTETSTDEEDSAPPTKKSAPRAGPPPVSPTGDFSSLDEEATSGEAERITAKHPAIAAYRGAAHRYPTRAWYAEVAETVGDDPANVERWRELVHDWVGQGWNPGNVKQMLEKYRKETPGPRVINCNGPMRTRVTPRTTVVD